MAKVLDVDLLPSGEHTDAFGNVSETSLKKLNALVDSYNPDLHKASVIVGHSSDAAFMNGMIPSDKLPSYGWVQSLYIDDDNVLHGLIEFVDEAIDWIERKLYDYRSIGLYGDESPYSPTQGQPYVRHVALLGAQPPAIKGLRPLSELAQEAYSENNGGVEIVTLTKKRAFTEEEDRENPATDPDQTQSVAPEAEDKPEVFQDEEEQVAEESEQTTVAETDSGDAEGAAPDSEGEVDGESFLNENAGEFMRFILQDGENGYQGEISRFEPEPSEDNGWLWDPETNMFAGTFVDESLGEPESFDFEIKQSGDAWEVSYIPANSDETAEEPVASEADSADEPIAEEPVEEPVEGAEGVEAPADEDEEAFGENGDFGKGKDMTYEGKKGKKPGMMGGDGDTYEEEKGKKMEPMAMGEGKDKDEEAFQETQNKLYSENIALRAELDAIRAKELETFVDGIYAEGRLIEGQTPKEEVLALANSLRTSGVATVLTYSEGTKQLEGGQLDVFKSLLSKLPVQVIYSEVLSDKSAVRENKEPIAPKGAIFSEDGLDQLQQIHAYAEANGLDPKKPGDFRKAMKGVLSAQS